MPDLDIRIETLIDGMAELMRVHREKLSRFPGILSVNRGLRVIPIVRAIDMFGSPVAGRAAGDIHVPVSGDETMVPVNAG